MADRYSKKGFWNLVHNFEGDKVIWMIVLILIMFSILAISSSTPLLALQTNSTRLAIIRGQLMIVSLGLFFIILIYNIKSIGFIRRLSQLGYALSFFLLFCLLIHIRLPFFKALVINSAYRVILIGGFQLHVFEVVKIAMIMYLAWAVDAYKRDDFVIANLLSKTQYFAFMGKDFWKKAVYIYIPILTVCVMTIGGSMSSALFIGMIMGITILIGGIKIKELIPFIFIAIILIAGCIGIHYVSGGKLFKHVGSAINRIGNNPEQELKDAVGTADFNKLLDKYRQPISAKVAVSEGGLIGKGPGKSTQRYIVPIMFEDYMYAFIIEEYGLFGAIIILILYGSLLARGAIVAKHCGGIFSKTTIAGLIMLISEQALLHILINVDLGPLTGQTLPMISHGNSSFIMFSIAFGIILSISRMAKNKIELETKKINDNIPTDEIRERMRDLSQVDYL